MGVVLSMVLGAGCSGARWKAASLCGVRCGDACTWSGVADADRAVGTAGSGGSGHADGGIGQLVPEETCARFSRPVYSAKLSAASLPDHDRRFEDHRCDATATVATATTATAAAPKAVGGAATGSFSAGTAGFAARAAALPELSSAGIGDPVNASDRQCQ